MVNSKRKKTGAVFEAEAVSRQDNVEEKSTIVLQNLISAEATLTEEKKKLASLREKLVLKVQKEIESKKGSIQKLRIEITDLNFSCDELTKSLQADEKSN